MAMRVHAFSGTRKKAFFFTLLAATLVLIMITLIKPEIQVYDYFKIPSKEARLKFFDTNLKNVENSFVPYALQDAGNRGVRMYIQYLTRNSGKPALDIDKVRDDLGQVIWNGSISGVGRINATAPPSTRTDSLLENASLVEHFDQISQIARNELRMNLTMDIINVTVFQNHMTGPDRLGITLNYTLVLNQSPFALWRRNNSINVSISIVGLNDTYYLFNTKQLGRPVYMHFTSIKKVAWDFATFNATIFNRSYFYDQKGLSFLHRLANSTEYKVFSGTNLQECCGLGTFINNSASYKKDGGNYYKRSFVDFCYFNDLCSVVEYASLTNITGVTNNTYPFQIHGQQAADFNVTDHIPIT